METGPRKKKRYVPAHKKVNLGGRVVVSDREGEKLRITMNAPKLYQHFLQTYARAGDFVSMEITLKKPNRSDAQNNFYHLYLDLISLSSGHSMAELKAWVNEEILGKGIAEVFGHTTRIVGHSSDLNTSEFTEMLNTVFERTGVPIPDPAPFNLPLTYDEYGKLKVIQTKKYKKMKPKKFIKKKKKSTA